MAKKKKLKITIKKDVDKDYILTKKNRNGDYKYNVVYPRFSAEGTFDKISLEFSEYEDIGHQVRLRFPEENGIFKRRNEYGEDFASSDGRIVILRYKYDNKGKRVITALEVM